MKYVRVPRELNTSDIRAEEFCFSPGRYVRFVPPKKRSASNFVPLDQLVVVREETVKASKSETYRYAEIGDIDVATGGICFREMKGYQLPTTRPARAERGDVLISTVRTYRKGIGLVTDTARNLVTTNAMLNLCATKGKAPGVTLPYIYSFLRSDFFVEQVWSLLNRGVYPRMDTGALGKILLPIAADEDVCRYVSALALAIADKEQAIRARDDEIHRQIEEELTLNQRARSSGTRTRHCKKLRHWDGSTPRFIAMNISQKFGVSKTTDTVLSHPQALALASHPALVWKSNCF